MWSLRPTIHYRSAKGGATFTPMPSYTTQSSLRDPDSHTSVVSEAMEKYSVSAVLEGVSRRQTMTVGSTAEEEHRDRAGGLEDKQFVGYVCWFLSLEFYCNVYIPSARGQSSFARRLFPSFPSMICSLVCDGRRECDWWTDVHVWVRLRALGRPGSLSDC